MIKDIPDSRYTQYMLDVNLENDLRNLEQKKLSPQARHVQKEILLDEYFRKSVLNREGEKVIKN